MRREFEYAEQLHAALETAGYTYDGVAELLGTTAHAALSRNETVPGLRRTTGGSPRETLTRLFLLQAPVGLAQAEAALPGLVDRLCVEGLLERSVGEVAARLDVRPYADGDRDLWVVSDLTPGLDGTPNRVGADHVLGISSASTSLAQLTIREPVGLSLDLGTGCGVQALHLAAHSDRVVATDVNQRALWMTQLNARLNGVSNVEVRNGSFFEPFETGLDGPPQGPPFETGLDGPQGPPFETGLDGPQGPPFETGLDGPPQGPPVRQKFDQIATNPPFVISPATGERLVYRDSGLPGDRVVEDIVRAAPDHLNDGGWAQILANWVITTGVPWDERLGSWLDGSCDALVVQREVVDPATYVELWLKDAGLQGTADYMGRYDTWLAWFEEQGIEAIGFGWVNLRKTGGEGSLRLEEWPYDVEQPIAPAVHAFGRAVDTLAGLPDDEALLAVRLAVRTDVQQETLGAPGAEDPHTVVLRQQLGFRRARQADTIEAALLGACDGELTVGQILDALAQLLGADPAETRTTYAPAVRELIAEGFLEPA